MTILMESNGCTFIKLDDITEHQKYIDEICICPQYCKMIDDIFEHMKLSYTDNTELLKQIISDDRVDIIIILEYKTVQYVFAVITHEWRPAQITIPTKGDAAKRYLKYHDDIYKFFSDYCT